MTSWQSKVAKMSFRWQRFRGQGKIGVDIDAERERFGRQLARLKPPEEVVISETDAGGRPALWVVPPAIRREGVVLFLHGGVYLIGSIQGYRAFAAAIAMSTGMRALILDYRLAPEHPFPAAVEDAQAAYQWLLEEGHKPQQIVVAGDSAGGGLALALLLALRDEGQLLPAAAVCLSPWTDLMAGGGSRIDKAEVDYVLTVADLQRAGALYLNGVDPQTPLASPLYGDLTGLPPLLIHVGADEILLDDATELAQKAEAAGVEVNLEIWEEMFHVWQALASFVPEGRQAIEGIGRFIDAVYASYGSPSKA